MAPCGVVGLLAGLVLLTSAPASARDFQTACEAALGSRSGAIVAVDSETGVLQALVNPGLAARAVPPGSVYKLVTALAGLERGQATPYTCTGRFKVPGEPARPCWKPGGHGRLTLEEAIAHSCNVYFYQLGARVGRKGLAAAARRVGLPGPGGQERLSDASVGEGAAMRVNALTLAGFVAAVATDGRRRTVGWTASRPGEPIAPAAHLARLRDGMRLAVAIGSARQAGGGRAVGGKTGTATYTDGSNRTFGWFVGYAPRLAVVVMVRDANGFHDAAPIGRAVFEAWRP